jgi:hypothetical protein
MSLLDRVGNRVGTQYGQHTFFRWEDWLVYARNVNARQLVTVMARLGLDDNDPAVIEIRATADPQAAGDLIAELQARPTP